MREKGLQRLKNYTITHQLCQYTPAVPYIVGFSLKQALSQTTETERKWNCEAAAPSLPQDFSLPSHRGRKSSEPAQV